MIGNKITYRREGYTDPIEGIVVDKIFDALSNYTAIPITKYVVRRLDGKIYVIMPNRVISVEIKKE